MCYNFKGFDMFLVLLGLQRGREGRQREGGMEKKREETHQDPP